MSHSRRCSIRNTLLVAFAVAAPITLAACSDETTAPDVAPEMGTIVADLSAGPAYIQLGDTARVVTISDPVASTGWDLALTGLQVRLNGGPAAASDVSGYCLCANEGLSAAELQALTAEGELAAFDAVTSSSLPPASAFEEDLLVPAISGWYSGAPGSGATANADASWILRRGTSSPRLSKFRVISLEGATAAAPGRVTLEYTTHTAAGGPFAPLSTVTLDVGSGAVYFSTAAGVVTEADEWDLLFDGWVIRVNGGVSGSGGVSAVPAGDYPFDDIDFAFAASVPGVAYQSDAFGGVFASHPWYRYNLTGTDHQVWPTYDVYLIRRGGEVYKVQFIGYYDEAGRSGVVTLRYARVTG